MADFGLIGYPLSHSFSKKYFTEKFSALNLSHCYHNFEIESVGALSEIIRQNPNLIGLNVTVPHKHSVLDFLNETDATASEVGAVNTILIKRDNGVYLKGYNTDVTGFKNSMLSFLNGKKISNALILGSGGSAKAVGYVLQQFGINFNTVSRQSNGTDTIPYQTLAEDLVSKTKLVINCTPLGKFPDIELFPPFPFQYLREGTFLFDLNYNPSITAFMKKGMEKKCVVTNGLEMLHLQAEASWNIWNT